MRSGATPSLRFDAAAQELFDGWRAELEHRLRAEEDHPVLLSHLAKYRSLLPSLALLFHLIDGVDTGRRGPVSRAAAAQAATRPDRPRGFAQKITPASSRSIFIVQGGPSAHHHFVGFVGDSRASPCGAPGRRHEAEPVT